MSLRQQIVLIVLWCVFWSALLFPLFLAPLLRLTDEHRHPCRAEAGWRSLIFILDVVIIGFLLLLLFAAEKIQNRKRLNADRDL